MGLWDDLKAEGNRVLKKIAQAVKYANATVYEPVKEAAIRFGKDVYDKYLGPAYDAAMQAAMSITAALQSTVDEAKDIADRAAATAMQHGEEAKREALKEIAEQQAQAARRAEEIVRKVISTKVLIARMQKAVDKAQKSRSDRLKRELERLRTRSREQREAWENDHADAIQALLGRKRQAEDLYDRGLRGALVVRDFVTIDIGTKEKPLRVLMPGGGIVGLVKKGVSKATIEILATVTAKNTKKVIELMKLRPTMLWDAQRYMTQVERDFVRAVMVKTKGIDDFRQIMASGMPQAVKRVAEVINRKGVEKTLEQIEKSPDRVLDAIARMTRENSAAMFDSLSATPAGKLTIRKIMRAAETRLKRLINPKINWKAIPGGIKRNLVLISAVVGLPVMGQFINEETRQLSGWSVSLLIKFKLWDLAEKQNELNKNLIETTAGLDRYLGWISVLKPVFAANLQASREQTAAYDEIIAAGRKTKSYDTLTRVTFTSNAPGTTFKIIGSAFVYVPDKVYELGSNRQYYVRATAQGYTPQTIRFYTEQDKPSNVVFELEKGKPATGTVMVKSTPQAEILIGGEDTGRQTPDTFTMDPGVYDFTLSAVGYKSETRKVNIFPGSSMTIDAILEPPFVPFEKQQPPGELPDTSVPETLAYVTITTEPWGAKVFVDGFMMTYPTPTKLDLDPGTHAILVEKEGFKPVADTITVAAGTQYRRSYVLEDAGKPGGDDGGEGDGGDETKVWRVWVNSDPNGALILVDDQPTGYYTYGYVDLLPGTYNLCVEKPRYERQCKEIVLGTTEEVV